MRLFFAVAIPVELIARIEATQRELKKLMPDPTIRWSRPDQFHYTVKFLGEVSMAKAQRAIEAAEQVCYEARPFQLTLGGVGAFPNAQRPSVLWIGATEGSAQFEALARKLDEALARQHFRKESRAPTAHLTVARIKTYDGEASVAAGLKRATVGEIGTMTVDSIVLMRSILKPTGSEYTIVDRYRFRTPIDEVGEEEGNQEE